MTLIKTVLNYSPASQANEVDTASVPIGAAEVTLVEWGHFVPTGTQFIEVYAEVGWEAPIVGVTTALELRIYQNGDLVASGVDEVLVSLLEPINTISHLKAILTSPTDQHNVYELRAIATNGPATVVGPLNVTATSYGLV